MDNLDRIWMKAERVNTSLHTMVKTLNQNGFKNIKVSEADLDQDADLTINDIWSISIPTISLSKGFRYCPTELIHDKKGEVKAIMNYPEYASLQAAIDFIKGKLEEKTKETNKMITKRESTTLEPSLAKRQAELKECDNDIEVLDATIETYEASYKGVYNAWCDFEECNADTPSNAKMLQRFEKVSGDVDQLFEDLKALKESRISARKQIQTMIDGWEKQAKSNGKAMETAGKSKVTPEAATAFRTFIESKGFTWGKVPLKDMKRLREEFNSDDKKASKPAGKPVGDDKKLATTKVKVGKVNEFLKIFVPELKASKVRVLDTQRATVNRSGVIKLQKGRSFEVTLAGKIILDDNGKTKTFVPAEAKKAIKAVQ